MPDWPWYARFRPIQQWPGAQTRSRRSSTFKASWSSTLSLLDRELVDRYGVTKRGEQYTGWKQLGGGRPMGPISMTLDQAVDFLVRHVDPLGRIPDLGMALRAGRAIDATYRSAAKALHPDSGGSNEDFQCLQEAKRVLDGAR